MKVQIIQLTQNEIDNLVCYISVNKDWIIILKPLIKKVIVLGGFKGEVYQNIDKELISVLHNLLQKIEEDELFIFEANIPIISK